jgi:hypothetical protein
MAPGIHFRLKDLLLRLITWLLEELLKEFAGTNPGDGTDGTT